MKLPAILMCIFSVVNSAFVFSATSETLTSSLSSQVHYESSLQGDIIIFIIVVKDQSGNHLGYFLAEGTMEDWNLDGMGVSKKKALNDFGSSNIKVRKVYKGKCAILWSRDKNGYKEYMLADGFNDSWTMSKNLTHLKKQGHPIEEKICNEY